jgi:hypothetical protein
VEHTTELSLSQGALLVEPCDKEELCDISLFTTSPQLDGEHTLVSRSTINILQENEIQLALSEETIPKPSPTSENKNCIDEVSIIVCSAISNFRQNKKDLATPIKLNHVNDETHSQTMAPREPIALVLNLSITSASLEQSLVEPVTKFPLLQDDYKIVPYDKEKLCDQVTERLAVAPGPPCRSSGRGVAARCVAPPPSPVGAAMSCPHLDRQPRLDH